MQLAAIRSADALLGQIAAPADRTIKHHAEKWLDTLRGEMKPRSYKELKEFARPLANEPLGDEMDVSALTADKCEAVFLALKNSALTPATKAKRWGFFRRFVRYLYGRELIDLPRNLDSLAFRVRPRAVKRYDLPAVRTVPKRLPDRLRLYALLAINCGMTNCDIGCLTKDMVDLGGATLTRKRVKTEDQADVPTVTYALWPETVALLRQEWSTHPTYALTSARNTPLWESRYDDGEKDLIVKAWKKEAPGIPLKAFRSIASAVMEGHPHYGRYVSHFLGHSPKSLRDRHYTPPSQELFDTILGWLRQELLAR
jgi:hypothetical protein